MTKTLTEQWREGTLPDGLYYVKTPTFNVLEKPVIENCIRGVLYIYSVIDYNVKEVLAPVPSYSEYQSLKDNCEFTHTRLKGTHQKITQLEKRLEIATKALKEYANCKPTEWMSCITADKALKEMEGVK